MSQHLFQIDLARCTGCHTCAVACKDRANLPDNLDWLRVEEHEEGAYPHPALYYRVSHCWHCAKPPCVDVCPTGAMAKGPDGVQVEAGLCVACGACIAICPFEAAVMHPEGRACKCDGCADEVAQGLEPTCVRACPMRALDTVPADSPLPDGRVPDEAFDERRIGPSVRYLRRA